MAALTRPFGVTIVALLAWLNGAWAIVQGTIELIAGATGDYVVAAWIAIVVGIVTILVSVGLFRGSNGARILVTIVFILNIVAAVALAVNGVPFWIVVPSIALPLIGLILLFTRRANEFFRS